MKHVLLHTLLLLASMVSFAQTTLSGRVLDAKNKAPLAFVSIVESGTSNGTYSDIDGYFSLTILENDAQILFNYVGYREEIRTVQQLQQENVPLHMHSLDNATAEVVVVPGVNPAERIIKAAIARKKQNDPEADVPFTYDSYNKLVFGAELDSLLENNPDSLAAQDSTTREVYDFFGKQYLFMMESVAKRKFLPPNHNEETIIANRVSGLKNTDFFLLATQLQSFSFYGETVDILGISYMSPLADGAIRKYLFVLEDTTYIEQDTVFTISFRPRKGKNFTGMRGQLFINTNGYALQHVIAEPAEADGLYIHIQQQYEWVQGRKWFPMQLNSYFTFPNMMVEGIPITGEGRSYIKNLQLDAPLLRKEFTPVTLLMGKDANKQPDSLWSQYRDRPLDARDTTTYHVIDSLGQAENFDAKLKIFESLATGRIPLGPVSIDLARLLRYNPYEGYRLGAGLHTNDKLSRHFNIGGYYAYGFKDKQSKYGGDVQLHIYKKRNAWARALYENDVMETGGNQMTKPADNFLTQGLYPFFVNRMDRRQKMEVQLNGRVAGNLTAMLFGNIQNVRMADGLTYTYRLNENVRLYTREFDLLETGLALRWARGEKLVRTSTREVRLFGYYPLLLLKVTKGWEGAQLGTIDYLRVDAMIEKTFRILNVGQLTLTAVGGWLQDNVPLAMLYNARGTNNLNYDKRWLGIAAPGSFETMRTNEYMHSAFVAMHLRHNFGSLLLKGEKFRPQFVLVHNMLWGRLHHAELVSASHNIPLRAATQGYYESGLHIDGLVKSGFTSLGIGAFYRYGPEHLPREVENWAFKLTSAVVF
ncbi:MAG: DUF5686 family protein [Flavobacteriales bacterium]